MNKIILVGYMAVGKTTIGSLLSEKINLTVVDLDKLIENRVGMSVEKIFLLKGEIYFRRVEHEIFKEIVESNEKLIISTGGGTPCYANNHLLLASENVISIYLKSSVEVLVNRLNAAKNKRPIVAGKSYEDLQEFVAKHLFERSYFYNQARFTVSVDGKNLNQIVDEIIKLLN